MTETPMPAELDYTALTRTHHSRLLWYCERADELLHGQRIIEDPAKKFIDTDGVYHKNIVSAVDGSPLYVFDESATTRCHAMQHELSAILNPTLPTNGATFACDLGATYIREATGLPTGMVDSAREYHQCDHAVAFEYCSAFYMPACTMFARGIVVTLRRVSDGSRVMLNLAIDAISHRPNEDSFWLYQRRASRLSDENATELWFCNAYKIGGAEIPMEKEKQSGAKDAMDETIRTCVAQALLNSAFVDLPTHFIVEERPAHLGEAPRKMRAKAARIEDRERWRILDPEAVRTVYSKRTDLGGTHASPVLHLRRGHKVTLRSERYKFRRGEVIYRRPTWVGDRECEVGKLRYRVVSRLGATEDQA